MRIGVGTWSYHRLVASGAMTELDLVAKTKELGFDAIEFSGLAVPAGDTAAAFAPRVRAACERAALPVSSYTVGADFLTGSGGDWRAEVERLKGEVRVAAALGAPRLRHDASNGFPATQRGPRSFDDALPVLVKGCRAVTEFAADLGIRTMVENHGHFCQDSVRVEKLVCGVAHPNFGALVDVGNFLCVDEDPGAAVGRLAPYAFHVHAKDFHVKRGTQPAPGPGWYPTRGGNWIRGAIVGHGEVPVLQCLRLLKRAGFSGELALEFEGLEEPLTGMAMGLANLRRYVQEASA
jgi:sugar phosphate isomerase/epimerase